MTTIVGDWNRKILVADSQYSDDVTGIKYFEEKIYKLPQGWFGGAGHSSDIEKALAWLTGKTKKKPIIKNSNSFLLLTEEGLFNSNEHLEWETCHTFMAIGSGAMAAEAILRYGAPAEEAVYMACQVDMMSHEPIRVYTLGSEEITTWRKE
jgi:hypothetical protein